MTFSSFASREEAGRHLARRLKEMNIEDSVVLALPRGGVPVASEVARELHAPLDVLLVRKIGVPWQAELAVAAIVDGGSPDLVVNEGVMAAVGISRAEIDDLARPQLQEIERRRGIYIGDREPAVLRDKTVIVVDDGIATGTTAKAALQALRRRAPRKLILAVPVGSPDAIADLQRCADQIICLHTPANFYAIGEFYRDFHQLSDRDVIEALARLATDQGTSHV
ncbi:phosphoribosyltransferase [Aestuariivirga sp.]|uniref:phosphoribosyltransferase n=1 Tax=Aestuariivirga sp. TaxID=2650926 RepID=UPI00391CA4E1